MLQKQKSKVTLDQGSPTQTNMEAVCALKRKKALLGVVCILLFFMSFTLQNFGLTFFWMNVDSVLTDFSRQPCFGNPVADPIKLT